MNRERSKLIVGVMFIVFGCISFVSKALLEGRRGGRSAQFAEHAFAKMRSFGPRWVPSRRAYENLGNVLSALMIAGGVALVVVGLA